MKREAVHEYEGARYPTLAGRLQSRSGGRSWTAAAFAVALAALAAVLGGCLPSGA